MEVIAHALELLYIPKLFIHQQKDMLSFLKYFGEETAIPPHED